MPPMPSSRLARSAARPLLDWLNERFHARPAGPGAPPRAGAPHEPELAAFIERVERAAAALAPGGSMEVAFPVTVKLAKQREEGGYAFVVGGLNRWWTRITENVQGTYYVDSSAVHRLTDD